MFSPKLKAREENYRFYKLRQQKNKSRQIHSRSQWHTFIKATKTGGGRGQCSRRTGRRNRGDGRRRGKGDDSSSSISSISPQSPPSGNTESVSREKKLSFRAVIFSLKVSHTSIVSTAHHNVRHVYSKVSLLMSNVEMWFHRPVCVSEGRIKNVLISPRSGVVFQSLRLTATQQCAAVSRLKLHSEGVNQGTDGARGNLLG